MYDEIKPSKKRVKKNYAALRSLIEKEDSSMIKRRLRLKPLIAAAVIMIISAVSLLMVVSAAPKATIVKFIKNGEEIEGECYDYVDSEGFRRISLSAVMPKPDANYAIIFDVAAPRGENVRVITRDTDPEYLENLRLYREAEDKAWETAEKTTTVTEDGVVVEESVNFPEIDPEDFGIVLKDSELCMVFFRVDGDYGWTSTCGFEIGGNFMHMGDAEGKPSGSGDPSDVCRINKDGTITWKVSFYYYVGNDFRIPEAADSNIESGECQTIATTDNYCVSEECQTVESAAI